MSLNLMQKKKTAQELQRNFEQLTLPRTQILSDLQFSEEELQCALDVTNTSGYSVWKLRDYVCEKLNEQGAAIFPFSILKENIWYAYQKTW